MIANNVAEIARGLFNRPFESCPMRYVFDHFSGRLFSGRRNNQLLAIPVFRTTEKVAEELLDNA